MALKNAAVFPLPRALSGPSIRASAAKANLYSVFHASSWRSFSYFSSFSFFFVITLCIAMRIQSV